MILNLLVWDTTEALSNDVKRWIMITMMMMIMQAHIVMSDAREIHANFSPYATVDVTDASIKKAPFFIFIVVYRIASLPVNIYCFF